MKFCLLYLHGDMRYYLQDENGKLYLFPTVESAQKFRAIKDLSEDCWGGKNSWAFYSSSLPKCLIVLYEEDNMD